MQNSSKSSSRVRYYTPDECTLQYNSIATKCCGVISEGTRRICPWKVIVDTSEEFKATQIKM